MVLLSGDAGEFVGAQGIPTQLLYGPLYSYIFKLVTGDVFTLQHTTQ